MAAEPREFDGLLRFVSGVRKLAWPVYWARSAESDGRQFWMVANGAGAAHAARAVDVAIPACQPQAIVSMGFCGALDPAMKIGDILAATSVLRGADDHFVSSAVCDGMAALNRERQRPVWPDRKNEGGLKGRRRLGACPTDGSRQERWSAPLASIDHVARTAAEKASLQATGALAVEMEAAGVAERAARYGLPFFCIKSVTDTAAQNFTIDFNKALRSDGHFGTIDILTSALRNPWKAFPELVRLSRSCRIAARTLGEFIAGCRF